MSGIPPVYRGPLGVLARLLRVPMTPPSLPPGGSGWVRSFGPAESYLRYLKIQHLLVCGALVVFALPVLLLAIAGMLREGQPAPAILMGVLFVIPTLAWMLVGYLVLQFQYDTTWYVMTERAIRLRSGIWVLKELTITFDNVQNVRIRQGPIQRWLGIGDVSMETAAVGAVGQHGATSPSTALVAGVADPKEIRDRIVERMRASRSAGLGDPDDGGGRRRPAGGPAHPGHTVTGAWTPAHLAVLRELRDEVTRLG